MVSVGVMFEYKSGVQSLNRGGFMLDYCRKWSLIGSVIPDSQDIIQSIDNVREKKTNIDIAYTLAIRISVYSNSAYLFNILL